MQGETQGNHARQEETRKYVYREMSLPLKRHMGRRPFLITVAADLSCISCQSALTAVETIDGVYVCTHVHCVNTARAAVFSLLSVVTCW